MKKALLFRLAVLVAAMMCALGAAAVEAYANYTPSDKTLTFYYDNYRIGCQGTTYDLNTGSNDPGWKTDGTFTSVTKVVFAPSFADARPTSTYYWFYGMQNLQTIVGMKEYLNTSGVTDMTCMFGVCSNLTSLDLSRFNTSKVTDMSSMFYYCSGLTSLDLSSFDTSKVTNMSSMFSNCSGLTSVNLTSFNTSKVTDMKTMFFDCQNLRTIYAGSGWSTAAVTSSLMMFYNCTSLVGGQGTAYDYIHYNKDYAHFDGGPSDPGYFTAGTEAYACYTPSNTTLTFYYDDQRSSRTGTIYDLNTVDDRPDWYTDGTYENVTQVVFDPSFANARPATTCFWFYLMTNLQSITGLSYLNTSEVTDMSCMFANCFKLTSLDVRYFKTSKVTSMYHMFTSCWNLRSLDLSYFNTSKVSDMRSMFSNCNLQIIYVGSGWSTVAVTESEDMFYSNTSLMGGQGTTYDENHVDAAYAHLDGGPSNPGYFSDKNAPLAYACYTPDNTTLTFYYDNQRNSRSGTTYNLNTGTTNPGWITDGTYENVTEVVFYSPFADARPKSTYSWFYNMQNLKTIRGLSYLNTSEVTNMSSMFGSCNGLTYSIDLSTFNTSNVTEMYGMFNGCSSLTGLDLSSFNTSEVANMQGMFNGCSSLTGLDLSSFNTSKVANMKYMFLNCTNLRTIYAGNGWNTANVTESYNMFYGCTSLVGGQGTTYDANHVDKVYAHIDGGSSNPGYFTDINGPIPYACYTPSNTTLTFYYDDQRNSRSGTTYVLNTGISSPGWADDGTRYYVTRVVFDASFADARPMTTSSWFFYMTNLQTITGMEYLNTSEVTSMAWMFGLCGKLTSLDLSHFKTSKVTSMGAMFDSCSSLTGLDLSSFNTSSVKSMSYMFNGCSSLRTVYADNAWSTATVTESTGMFNNCTSLMGGQGTAYDEDHVDATYAHIDGGPSNPGYFTDKNASLRGDVNGDGSVNISDVTALIDLLLGGGTINNPAADCNQDSSVNISDVTSLIDYLLSSHW